MHTRLRLAMPAAVLALSLGVAAPAAAAPPAQATGYTTTLSENATLIRTADGNQTYAVVEQGQYTGSLSGLFTDTATLIVHPDGTINGHGTETCTCTLGGHTGTYVAVLSVHGTFASFQGHLTVLRGSGGLTGLHGQGTFQGSTEASTQTLNYHFEP